VIRDRAKTAEIAVFGNSGILRKVKIMVSVAPIPFTVMLPEVGVAL